MNYKHNEHIKIVDNKWEAKRIAQSLKNLGYKARVVRRHFGEGSANYDVVYSKEKFDSPSHPDKFASCVVMYIPSAFLFVFSYIVFDVGNMLKKLVKV